MCTGKFQSKTKQLAKFGLPHWQKTKQALDTILGHFDLQDSQIAEQKHTCFNREGFQKNRV
jgi:hypothetical protein